MKLSILVLRYCAIMVTVLLAACNGAGTTTTLGASGDTNNNSQNLLQVSQSADTEQTASTPDESEVSVSLNYNVNQDSRLQVNLATHFSDAFSFEILPSSRVSIGSVQLSSEGLLNYDANANVTGIDSIVFSAVDTNDQTVYGRLNINIHDQNGSMSFNYTIDRDTLISNETATVVIDESQDISDIEVFSDTFEVEIDGLTVHLTASKTDRYRADSVMIWATQANGDVLVENIQFATFPHKNFSKGYSLQGEHSAEKLNLVVMGDGYREEDKFLFFEEIKRFIEKMEDDPGIGLYMSAWSVHGVFTPSVNSGVDDGSDIDSQNTYFNSYYNCASIQRLICTDSSKAFQLAADQYPEFDTVVMIVNDSRYGGSGGSISVFAAGQSQIALHELGHTFAGLADEYVDSNIAHRYSPSTYEEGTFHNISIHNDPHEVPWSHWIDGSEVGVFEGGLYNDVGFFRPSETSVMRNSNSPFGAVNAEIWVRSIYEKVDPISEYSPLDLRVEMQTNEKTEFSVRLPFDIPIQQVRWYVDERELTQYQDVLSIAPEFTMGRHTLIAEVSDTESVRDWGHLENKRRVTWQIEVVR